MCTRTHTYVVVGRKRTCIEKWFAMRLTPVLGKPCKKKKEKKKKEPQMHTETRTQEMFKYGFAQFEHLPCETLSSLSLALLCSYTCDPQQQSRANHV